MRRRGSALVEFGLVIGVMIALLSSVIAFVPVIASKSKVIDATVAAALESSTYRAPDDQASTTVRAVATQKQIVCRNASLVAYRMLAAAGMLAATDPIPTDCGESANARMWIDIGSDFRLTNVGQVPVSPFQLCLTYRYTVSGGISYLVASGVGTVDRVVLPTVPLGACTAVYLDDDRTEQP